MTDTNFVFYISKEKDGFEQVLKIDADLELPTGSIALASFNNKVGFSDLKTMPDTDINIPSPAEAFSVTALDNTKEQTDEPKIEIKDAGSKNERTNQEKVALFGGCLDKKSPDSREKYCLEKFNTDTVAVDDCKVKLNNKKKIEY